MSTEQYHRVQINTWRVQLNYASVAEETNYDVEFHFSSEGLAKLAVEWAYAVRLEAVNNRTDAWEVLEFPVQRNEELDYYNRKLYWHKKADDGGYYCMKDYFSYDQVTFEREILYP